MPSDLRHLPKKFGSTVRELRMAAELTQITLAEAADLTHNYVGEIERGEKMASLDSVVRLARAFGMSGAELLKRSGV